MKDTLVILLQHSMPASPVHSCRIVSLSPHERRHRRTQKETQKARHRQEEIMLECSRGYEKKNTKEGQNGSHTGEGKGIRVKKFPSSAAQCVEVNGREEDPDPRGCYTLFYHNRLFSSSSLVVHATSRSTVVR